MGGKRRRFFFFVFPRFFRRESFAGDGKQNGRGLGGDEDDSRVRVGGERVVERAEKRPGAQRRRSGGKPRRALRVALFAAGTPLHLGERPAPLRSGPGSRGGERIRVLGNGPGEVRAVRVPGDGDERMEEAGAGGDARRRDRAEKYVSRGAEFWDIDDAGFVRARVGIVNQARRVARGETGEVGETALAGSSDSSPE